MIGPESTTAGSKLFLSAGKLMLALTLCCLLASCKGTWNDPYPASDAGKNILYSYFDERPKHLDPVQSYSEPEYRFIGQIYEPVLQYHFLKRPYTLVPLTASSMPEPEYYDEHGKRLATGTDSKGIAYTIYEIHIKPGILYQPHPAFARDEQGKGRYFHLTESDLEKINSLSDFKYSGTRELVAADYIYQIKRLAHPRLQSPLFSLMSDNIVGLKEYAETLKKAYAEIAPNPDQQVYLDLTRYPLPGVELVDRYTYRLRIKGKYPQILYWLAMPFFAPMAPEVDRFYTQPGMKDKNLTLDWYPVGTGPYMLTENNPNRRMVLERNPNFRGEPYPSEGMPGDREAGMLDDAGKRMPFIDKVVYSLEKEQIPYWNKFLQGYYDVSGVASDSFDQAIQFNVGGEAGLTDFMQAKGIKLITSVETSSFYNGFNMLDPVVGGYSERARKLRQAISIALDYEDFISIFRNGRGIPAYGPLPPGIFGYREGEKRINPYVYDYVNGKIKRKSIAEAKRLLAEAGYPGGRDAKTGKPLLLHLDITGSGPEFKSIWDWYLKQFRKINLELVIRNTDYNRFQDKIRKGNAQLFFLGWNADYPDPENFLFLLYGPNGKVKYQGENAANYANPQFDRLFEKMKNMDNGPERQAIIDKMVDIVRRDAPWVWGFHPKAFVLHHAWYKNAKPNLMAQNGIKYRRIDPVLREKMRALWNRPVIWPIFVVIVILILFMAPAVYAYRRKERKQGIVDREQEFRKL
jgi:ABC-type transport system substrate-binding protein